MKVLKDGREIVWRKRHGGGRWEVTIYRPGEREWLERQNAFLNQAMIGYFSALNAGNYIPTWGSSWPSFGSSLFGNILGF